MKTSTITRWLFLFFVMMAVAATAAADDPIWPRQITKPGGKLVIYQPQVDDWKDFQQVDARMAFTITPTGGKSTRRGDDRSVAVRCQYGRSHRLPQQSSRSRAFRFPSLDPATTTQMDQLMRTFLNPAATMTISLDRLVASVKKTKTPPVARCQERSSGHLHQHAPGNSADGERRARKRAHRELESAIRRECQLAVVQSSRAVPPTICSTAKAGSRVTAWQGTWTPTSKLPKQMSKVPENSNFTDLKGFIPPPPGSTASFPVVYYSATPAEIVVFGGEPQWTPIAGHATVVRLQHQQLGIQVRADGRLLLPDLGPLVHRRQPRLGPGHLPPTACLLISRRFPRTVPPGRYWRLCPERRKPKTRC